MSFKLISVRRDAHHKPPLFTVFESDGTEYAAHFDARHLAGPRDFQRATANFLGLWVRPNSAPDAWDESVAAAFANGRKAREVAK